jgi:hypothetical protein
MKAINMSNTCQKSKFCPVTLLLAALLIGGGFAAAGYFLAQSINSFSNNQRAVSVRGFAERDVQADLALWQVRFTTTGNDLADVQNKIESDTTIVRDFFLNNGFDATEIMPLQTEMTDLLSRDYRPEGADKGRYIINAGFRVRTTKVDALAKLASTKLGDLFKAGIVLRDGQQPPNFIFTKLKTIKPQMVAEATADARTAAVKFAADSGAALGQIKGAEQGVFQILPRDQADGISAEQEINKTVRVVTNVTYFLQ